MKKVSRKPKTAKEFDKYFEDNDITQLLDLESKRINVDLPASVLKKLDAKADQIGLTRQALIKYWIAEKLKLVE
jgi:hypothetical protein